MADIKNITIDGTTYDLKDDKARNDITDLKEDFDNIDEILEVGSYPKDTKSVSTTSVKILDGLEFKAGHTYTVTCSIPSSSASTIYCYWKKSDDTAITSGSISPGSTSWGYTLAVTSDFTGYVCALTNIGTVDVTAEVTSDIPLSNAIERIDSELDSLESSISTVNGTKPADGYSIISSAVDSGAGAYYKQSGKAYKNTGGSYGTDYTYYVFDIDADSYYSFSIAPRWIVLENPDESVYSDTITGKYIYTGTATRLYFTINNVYVTQLAISKGFWANHAVKSVLDIAPTVPDNRGNSLSIDTMYFSVGITEKLYYRNMMSIPTDYISLITSCNNQDSHDDVGVTITPVSAFSNPSNAVRIKEYDQNYNLVYSPEWRGLTIKALNLSDCSAIVIGDSTVGSWGTMTEHMLDVFSQNGKTLTLMGTRGSGDNKHEGRGGWSAKAYCTEASHGDYTNPFLNNGAFDFSYYMAQQGYSKPDFVVIQLGINDISNTDISDFDTISRLAMGYEQEMIDSILAYDDSIKVLINPPTCPNSNRQYLSEYYETTVFRNMIIRYAMMLRRMVTRYPNTKVRASNMNLLLDTTTDIRDNVHPTTEGFYKMGDEVVNQFNCWMN